MSELVIPIEYGKQPCSMFWHELLTTPAHEEYMQAISWAVWFQGCNIHNLREAPLACFPISVDSNLHLHEDSPTKAGHTCT